MTGAASGSLGGQEIIDLSGHEEEAPSWRLQQRSGESGPAAAAPAHQRPPPPLRKPPPQPLPPPLRPAPASSHQLLRDEQDAAYYESLAKDRARQAEERRLAAEAEANISPA